MYLDKPDMENNAKLVRDFFLPKGWTLNAICGMLGNMETESTLNPGLWESLQEGNMQGGFGLVQWTPATNLIDWAGSEYLDGDKQCARIIYEYETGIEWIPTSEYPMSWEEFKTSTQSPDYLAMAFIKNYERPFDSNQPIRGEQALAWFEFLDGQLPPEPPTKKKKMPLYFYLKRH